MAGKKTRAPKARGHHHVVREDAIARETMENGFIYLDPNVDPDISIEDLESIPRETRREDMDLYFRAKIEVFEADQAQSDSSWVLWTVRLAAFAAPLVVAAFVVLGAWWLGGTDVGIAGAVVLVLSGLWAASLYWKNELIPANLWPGFFEQRLLQFTERRFGEAGRDMRQLISRLIHVFLDNLRTFIRRKRLLQAGATFGVTVPAFVLLWLPDAWLPSDNVPLALFAAGVGFLVFTAADWWFGYVNGHLHEHYSTALEHSARDVSIKITQRMKSLSQIITQYITKLQEIQQKGEKVPGAAGAAQLENMRDEQLQDGSGFFYIQTILFLAKNNEHLELFLWDEVHRSRREHMMLDARGFALTLSVLLFFAGIQAFALVLSANEIMVDGEGLRGWFAGALAMAGLVMSWVFAERSYASPAWTSGADILEKRFDSADWDTYAKLKIDVKLAARFQRAIYWIRDLFELRRER